MVIVYPRECASCKRGYATVKTFSAHKRRCAKYTANIVFAEKVQARELEQLEQRSIDNLLLSVQQPQTEGESPTASPVVATTRLQYLETCSTFYVVQTAHSFKCGLNVYKIGRTTNMKNRLTGYPKGSIVIQQLICRDATFFEDHIKTLLMTSEEVQHRKDFGIEYFEGDLMPILKIIWNAYEQTAMSPSHVNSVPIDTDASKHPDNSYILAKIDREYQNMMIEKKLFAIAKHKQQYRQELCQDLSGLLAQFNMNKEVDEFEVGANGGC